MAGMQRLAPAVKQLQTLHKSDPQLLNQKMMALYKEHKVNPLAGCVPLLIQFPVLIGLFWAIQGQIKEFGAEHWLWIGSPISTWAADHHLVLFKTPVLATSLAAPDVFLLVLYVITAAMLISLGGRLYYLQVMNTTAFTKRHGAVPVRTG